MVPIARPSELISEHFIGHVGGVDEGVLGTPLESAPSPPDVSEWTPAQRDNAVTARALAEGVHPSRIRRLGIFMDAAGFTKQESFEGLFITDLDTGQKFLVCIIRKADYCNCGCRGFCTLWPVHDAILSDLQSAADGRWSVLSHLREPFHADTVASTRAGQPMGVVLAVTEIRADMPGYTGPMGFRASSHCQHPCCVCNVSKAGLQNLSEMSLAGGPADTFTTAQYRELVTACSAVVKLSNASDIRNILSEGRLTYDHRKVNGYLGRRLCKAVTLTSGDQLFPGDRLHPSRLLRDVADFESLVVPAEGLDVLFWRVPRPKTARLLHRSPLMDLPGVGTESYAIDILHTWHLGGIPRYVGHVLWAILRRQAYSEGVPRWFFAEEEMHIKMLRMRSTLWVHYKAMIASDPTWHKRASQVWNLTIKESNPCLKAKASESRHLLDFAVSLLEEHVDKLDAVQGPFLLASGRAAQQVNAVIRECPRVMAVADQQRLLNAYLRHCSLYCRAGGVLAPKHHLMIHYIQRISYLGNPRFYSCYQDESLNGVVVKIARSCHRLTFMHSVHNKYRWAGQLGLSTHMF